MEFRDWLAVINFALVPILIYLRRIDHAFSEFSAWITQHDKADDRRFDEIERRISRVEIRQERNEK